MNEENPYRLVIEVSDSGFNVRTSAAMATRFLGIGCFFALLSGLWFEYVPNSSSAVSMGAAGLQFGLGVAAATTLWVPERKWRMALCAPVVGLVGFVIVGVMYDNNAALVFGFGRGFDGYVRGWALLAFASLPGVFCLSLLGPLIARPKSRLRVLLFVLIAAGLAGIAPLVTGTLTRRGRFFATMFIAQTVMYATIGWLVGDSDELSQTSDQHAGNGGKSGPVSP